MPDNTICWSVIEHLYLETNRAEIVRDAEWGPGAADIMIEKVKAFPIPSGEGLTMADLIDETPRELISQVALEGKVEYHAFVVYSEQCRQPGTNCRLLVHGMEYKANIICPGPCPSCCCYFSSSKRGFLEGPSSLAKVSQLEKGWLPRVLLFVLAALHASDSNPRVIHLTLSPTACHKVKLDIG